MHEQAYDIMSAIESEYWWYRGRRNLVNKLLKEHQQSKKLKIFDIGCGSGLLMKELEIFGDVYGIDTSPAAIKYCTAKGIRNVQIGHAENLPFQDESFDVVLAMDVFEHIKDDSSAVAESKRILKKNGILIASVPAVKSLWGEMDVYSHHYRRYSMSDFRLLVSSSDFTILKISYYVFFLFFPIAAIRSFKKLVKISYQPEHAIKLGMLNIFFYWTLLLENWLIKNINFPVGTSLIAVLRKNQDV